ncbi:MAG: bifunctional 4-hydroxy-2-oxoglutarate aldolase/2-dehydro-3-deoxy-phosphogluconate aldolase [Candidatus Melainabacteria bacterium]|nr:bifunctional 4-hydroxy-2-oxoglutarate aldolase/2-dehydro-3-deoxy-phosphogluconate aldolase [Candidatus Melainabacteria bacterium]
MDPKVKTSFNYLNARLVGILRTKPGTQAKNAISAIQTAFDAGAGAVEITSNSDFWQEILSECVKRNLNIGVGSVKNEKTAGEAIGLGAKFLVSPGFFEDAIALANKHNTPILPGVFTAPNFQQAIDLKIADTKFFPANAKTHEELFKAIKEPFRDEFEELQTKGWEIIYFDPLNTQPETQSSVIKSPTQFYKLYLSARNKKPDSKVVIKLPDEKDGFERMKEFSKQMLSYGIRTYAVGGVNDKNMKEILTKYGAYGVCPGSGMFNGDAIFNGDFERVRVDVKRHVEAIKEIFGSKNVGV